MDVRRIPVIIVGAGVGGLATSALLAKHRIPSLLVESGGRSSSIRRPAT